MSQRNRTSFALAILFFINTLNFFDRQILASVTEILRKEWSLSDTSMGWLGTAFTLIYAAVGLPLGSWADRGKRTTVLSASIGIWTVFTAASGLAWNYWSMFIARLGVGIGEAGCSPAANSLIGDMFPAAKRARAISVFMLGLPIGLFLCNFFSGTIAKNYGWQAPFFIATIPGIILAVLALKIIEPERGANEEHKFVQTDSSVSFWQPYREVLKIPTMRWLAIAGALHNFNAYAVNAFMPAYLGRFHGLDNQTANIYTAYTIGAVGVIGLLGGGMAADWARKWRSNGRLLIGAFSLLFSTPLVFFALTQVKGEISTFIALLAVGWTFFYVYYVTVYPAIQDVVDPAQRGTAMALYFFAMYVLGGAFGTTVLGMLSDYSAKSAMLKAGATTMNEAFKAEGLHNAFFVVPLVSLLLAAVLFAASRTITKDMERLKNLLLR